MAIVRQMIFLKVAIATGKSGTGKRIKLQEAHGIVAHDKGTLGVGEPRLGDLERHSVVVGAVFQIMSVCSQQICHSGQVFPVGHHLCKIGGHIHWELG